MESFLDQLRPIWSPHPGQREFLLAEAGVQTLACGRRWGKTDAAAVKALGWLLDREDAEILVASVTLDQTRILFDRLVELLAEWLDRFGGPKPEIRRAPHPLLKWGGRVVRARSGKIAAHLRGYRATHILIDEAAYLPEKVITEVAMPMLATTHGTCVLLSTPWGHNHFWRFFTLGQTGREGYWSRRGPSAESPYVSASFLAGQREILSERGYAAEYEAEFVSSAGQVFPQEQIEEALDAEVRMIPQAMTMVGVDWARYSDYTAVVVAQWLHGRAQIVEVQRWQGGDWASQVEWVAGIVRGYPSGVVWCDGSGVGDPVVEMLRSALPQHAVQGFTFTTKSKLELIDGLRWRFDRRQIGMAPHPDLLRELAEIRATPGSQGHTRIAAPSGGHDDLVMALALACYRLPRGEVASPILLASDLKFSRSQPGSLVRAY